MRLRALWPACLLPLAIGCSPAPRPSPAPPAPKAPEPAQDPLASLPPDLRDIAREVEAARGLRFRRPLTYIAVDDQEFESRFDEGRLEATPDAAHPPALWAFGFLKRPPLPTWLSTFLSRRGPQAGGILAFYVDASRRVYARKHLAADPGIVAHELAHALVHDHFHLSFDVPTDDQQLALRAVTEGDATVTASLVLQARKGKSVNEALRKATSWDKSTRDFVGDTDAALGASLPLFHERTEVPYHAGAKFMGMVALARGIRGLDEIWAEPPRGTFEVFHPDLYARGLPLPRVGAFSLPEGCRSAFEGQMGEMRTRSFLREVHPRATALAGAHGLLADRYRLLEGCGSSPAFVWQTAWMDEPSAARFEGLVKQQLGCTTPGCLAGPSAVSRRGSAVVVLRGLTDEAISRSALAAIEPPTAPTAARLGGVTLEPPADDPHLVEGSSGKPCAIATSGVSLVTPKGMAVVAGQELRCAMGSDTVDVSLATLVTGAAYDQAFLTELRKTLPQVAASSHARVHMRERNRVTPLGTGRSFVLDLTQPQQLEVVVLPICAGRRVLALYLRTTNEEGRSMLEDALSSLRPVSVGLAAACADPVDE